MPPAETPDGGNPRVGIPSALVERDDGHLDWVRALGACGPDRTRRWPPCTPCSCGSPAPSCVAGATSCDSPAELDDLADQSADDALLAITAKLGEFRGESRFTTWAYMFVILEVSNKIGRHFCCRPTVTMETDDWDRLPDRLGMGPPEAAQHQDLLVSARLDFPGGRGGLVPPASHLAGSTGLGHGPYLSGTERRASSRQAPDHALGDRLSLHLYAERQRGPRRQIRRCNPLTTLSHQRMHPVWLAQVKSRKGIGLRSFDLDERDGRPGFVRSRAGMSFVNIAKVRAALRRASRLKVHVSSIVMDFLVYSRGAPVAGDSEDDPELDEQHWSYMDGFADGMTARGPTFGTDRQTWTGSLRPPQVVTKRPCEQGLLFAS